MTDEITDYIPICYETDDVKVSLKVRFGKAKNAKDCSDAYLRTKFDIPYNIEKHIMENEKHAYCLLAEEGPFSLKITDVNIESKTNVIKRKLHNGIIFYNYGITVVLDMNKEPEYSNDISFIPNNNIERDGVPWIVHNNKVLCVDQNGKGIFQWSTARALEKGVKPTPEQELMGIEERHDNSGMIYITIQPMYTEEMHIEQEPTRGLTRGLTPSHAARVGYGERAETKSKSSSVIHIANSRYILPIRIRNIGEVYPDTICAKDLKSAMRIEELQKKTGVIPDY
jgi:hypothetical protein